MISSGNRAVLAADVVVLLAPAALAVVLAVSAFLLGTLLRAALRRTARSFLDSFQSGCGILGAS
ncbi:hypothetical protein GCM10027174_13260 [Salinifilum aidingensis]